MTIYTNYGVGTRVFLFDSHCLWFDFNICGLVDK